MPIDSKTYKKHHSFETFVSSLGSDTSLTTQRVLTVLKKEMQAMSDQKTHSTIEAAIKDLSNPHNNGATFKITVHIADEISKLEDNELSRYIVHRYRYDVFPQTRTLDEYPPYLQIEPTSVCNYRCVFCYQTDIEFTTKSGGFMGAMTLDLFKKIIDQIVGKVEFISLASRGEPLICKDIDAMLKYCSGKFLGLKLNTNASLLTEEHCHAILAGGINTIVFSADAAEEPLYSQLRVKGNLDNVLRNIKLFQTIKAKHYTRSKMITRVSGVKFNDDQDMSSMKGLWGDLVDQVAFVAYNPWENVYEADINSVMTPCSDLWRRMFVWYDGKVNPCDTDYKSTLCVGNIKEKSISQIWRSQGYEQLREAHLNKTRSKLNPCRRCVVI